jgi:hypothetical protein
LGASRPSGRDRALRFYLRPARVGWDGGFLRKPRMAEMSGPEDSRCDHSRVGGREAGWGSNGVEIPCQLPASRIGIDLLCMKAGCIVSMCGSQEG